MRLPFAGTGMLTYSPSIIAASVRVLEELASPTCKSPSPLAASRAVRSASSRRRRASAPAPGRCGLCRGYVEAKSNRPGERRRSTRTTCRKKATGAPSSAACGLARRLFAAPALQRFVREETLPGPSVQADDELLDYARRNGGTCYHASCTCLMGSHPMSVVDSELRVHGMDGLRVIDASVMPAVTSTNTNAPTIMIAEKGAALIKGAARQRMAA